MHIILSSLLFLGSLPPFSIPIIGCFFLIPLLVNREDQHRRLLIQDGFLFALIVSSYSYFGTWAYDIYAYLAMVLIFSVLFTVFLYCAMLMIYNKVALAILIVPLLWVFIELSLETFNLPVTLVIPLTASPTLLLPAQFGGQYALSFLLIAFQVALIVLSIRLSSNSSITLPASMIATIACAFLFSILFSHKPSLSEDVINASIIQTNAHPRDTVAIASDNMLEELSIQRNKLLMTVVNATIKPNLIIWPEVSLAKFEFRKKDSIKQQADAHGVSMLVASPDLSPSGQVFNSIFSISSSGTVLNRYDKNILIPFLENESRGPGYWTIHDKLPGRPGSLICYESIFTQPAALLSKTGAGFLSLATNDAYAGPSILPELHLQFSKLRAVETGKTVIRAANAGPSAVITADGRIDKRLGLFKSGIINARIQPDYSMTFFVRHYHSVLTTFWILSTLAIFIFLITCLTSSKGRLPRQSAKSRHFIIAAALMCCVLIFQHFYMRHLYQGNSGDVLPASFVNFQQQHGNGSYSYAQLKASTPDESMLSAITYLLRHFGNNVNLSLLREELSPINLVSTRTDGTIDISSIFDRFDYSTTSKELTHVHANTLQNIKTPCLTLLSSGESVVITEFTDNGVIFFSPYYAELLAIKTAAFMQKWTGKIITLSTRKRPWDI